jgi:hypothetical protein
MIDRVRIANLDSDEEFPPIHTYATIDILDSGSIKLSTDRKNFLVTEIRALGEALIRTADLHQKVMQQFLDYKESVYAAEADFIDSFEFMTLQEDPK